MFKKFVVLVLLIISATSVCAMQHKPVSWTEKDRQNYNNVVNNMYLNDLDVQGWENRDLYVFFCFLTGQKRPPQRDIDNIRLHRDAVLSYLSMSWNPHFTYEKVKKDLDSQYRILLQLETGFERRRLYVIYCLADLLLIEYFNACYVRVSDR